MNTINTDANQIQASIKKDSTVSKKDITKMNQDINKVQLEIQKYIASIKRLGSITNDTHALVQQSDGKVEPAITSLLAKVTKLYQAYLEYSKVIQAIAKSDQHYYGLIASGTKPAPDNYHVLTQDAKKKLQVINLIEKDVVELSKKIK
jgi:hypothetical protein